MEATQNATVVKMAHLQKSFGDNEVLKDISLTIHKGETVVVLGKSGSGKSVLIKCMVRLLDVDEGKVSILGSDIFSLNRKELNLLRMKIGFLFQGAALYDSLTVRENLEFPLRQSGKPREEIDALVMEVLQSVGLEDAVDLMPSELSGGMRKRIGLARSMILKPEIMLYDEPTTGLDPITAKEISNLILEVQKKYNTTSIIITHDIQCARITANRMLILNNGVFVAEGAFDELKKSEDKLVHSFFE
ncbi:MAG: ATP-binding cassette domain-containing protein [Chitinophagales bacterium]|nr:ATP-binding cassette domain-containing protein [Chitinophagales bacterium]